jgi:PPOX class probable F420-dependent enzyme
MSDLTMTKNQRANFLAELHVGVLTIEREGSAPLAAPVWYSYEPGGDVVFSFEGTSEKLDLTRRAGTASLCVQNETMPYQYVTVEGPMTVGETDHDVERELAYRYLGQEIGDIYLEAVADTVSRVVRLSPARWRTVDYSAMVDRLLGAPTP